MEPDEPSPESDIEIFLKTERANKIFGIAEATSKSVRCLLETWIVILIHNTLY